MTKQLLDRIVRESGVADLLDILAERLAPTDLQSLLLEVARRRAAQQTPSGLLKQYERNRFVRPSAASPPALLELDRLAFSLVCPPFEPIELSPVCPLGTNSVVAPVDQNITVATIRNTEVVSDATNVLALECALRRRSHLRADARSQARVKLCASHRLLRAQNFNRPGLVSHFRLFSLVTAGRDEGSYRFELECLYEHVSFYLRLLSAVEEIGHSVSRVRIAITDLTGGALIDRLEREVMEPLAARHPGAQLEFDPDRTRGRGYYESVCCSIHATDAAGSEHELADSGFTNWTQRLLSNQKERLLISGIAPERVCSLFR